MSARRAFLKAGLSMSYMRYAATGEGVLLCIAVAGSSRWAEQIIKEKLPDYYHVGIVTCSLSVPCDETASELIEWIPSQVMRLLTDSPRGGAQYFVEFHLNNS